MIKYTDLKCDSEDFSFNLGSYNREYCCSNCGLIWVTKVNLTSQVSCPECNNNCDKAPIYACDTNGYAYAYSTIESYLRANGKNFHYDKNHPICKK